MDEAEELDVLADQRLDGEAVPDDRELQRDAALLEKVGDGGQPVSSMYKNVGLE